MHLRRWGRGRLGDVLRSIALMTATIWSLITVWLYPHLIGVARVGILHFQYGRQADQARESRGGCSGLFEIHILGSEFLLGSDSAA